MSDLRALLQVVAALLLYGAFHSVTAAVSFKSRAALVLGERAYLGLYRLGYSIVSMLTLLPVLGLMSAHPGRTVWSTHGMTAAVLLVIRATGGVGLIMAFAPIDALRFLGIKEMLAYLKGEPLPLPPEPLVTRGVYRLVRHPLYLFGLLALWASPTMTEAGLGFSLGVTLYAALGSILEERKLVRTFGAEYLAYRKTVPWLVPFVKRG